MASFDHLPPGIVPFAVSADVAAALIGVSEGLFLAMVDDGRMPQPRPVNRLVRWDTEEVRAAWRSLPRRGEAAPSSTWKTGT